MPTLPCLREDLRISEGPTHTDGTSTWTLYDPLAHVYHRLSTHAFNILSQWPSPDCSAKDINDMTAFLYMHKLTQQPPNTQTADLAQTERSRTKGTAKMLLHSYVFFRIPLFQPQRFLELTAPFLAPLFSKPMRLLILILGGIGGGLAIRQWDVFVTTFLHFLSFEGLLYYGLTLFFLKIAHELGHAYMAHKFGCKVPVIGVAFLLLFPILYTDTTDAWRLKSRRERVLIDAGGMLVELAIACLALFAWNFLPDGTARSLAFFIATTSIGLSLFVNLNPLMRFDGYYLLCDIFGQHNLQMRGFAHAKWKMRETLFNLREPPPQSEPHRIRFWLLLYAYSTWIYRFFLFIGIALLVHALFPKALGIPLFCIEIWLFILTPIYRELKIWWSFKMKILTKRTGFSLIICSAFLAAFFIPWQTTIRAPALIRPLHQSEIYSVTTGRIDHIFARDNEAVQKGQLLIRLSSETLDYETRKSRTRLKLLQTQYARRTANIGDLAATDILRSTIIKEQEHLAGIENSRKALEIRAPQDGIIKDLNPDLHIQRYINPNLHIATLVKPETTEILAYISERHLKRITKNTAFIFIPENGRAQNTHGQIDFIAPTTETTLTNSLFSSPRNGSIPVHPNTNTPISPVIRVQGRSRNNINIGMDMDTSQTPLNAILRGQIHIHAKPQSPAYTVWQRIYTVLIREIDF